MNDFTKEELVYIKNYIFCGASSISVRDHEILRNKIQSMIDNYCEHESDGKVYCPGLYNKLITGEVSAWEPQEAYKKCTKCGEFYR